MTASTRVTCASGSSACNEQLQIPCGCDCKGNGKTLLWLVMLVGDELGGATLLGGKGGEFSRQLCQSVEEPLRMNSRLLGQVCQQGVIAIQKLE